MLRRRSGEDFCVFRAANRYFGPYLSVWMALAATHCWVADWTLEARADRGPPLVRPFLTHRLGARGARGGQQGGGLMCLM